MEMTDLSNILGQETIKKIYEDGVSESTKEIGKASTDIVKTLRLFLAPFQLGAAYQDRFVKFLDKIRESVPEEKQIPCPPSIAGPVFEKLKYIEETNYLKDLYLNLLQKAIDKDRINEAHPAFVSLIEQLSPDEALTLKVVAENRISIEIKFDTIIEVGSIPSEQIIKNNFPLAELIFPQNFNMYVSHLTHMNLIETPQYNLGEPDASIDSKPAIAHRFIKLSNFGELFYKACIK